MPTSSAAPAALIGYGREATTIDDELTSKATATTSTVAAFQVIGPDYGGNVANPGPAVASYASKTRTTDEWVGRIGQAFHRADYGGLLGWLLAPLLPPGSGVVEVDDDAVLDAAGWPTEAQAADAGRTFADQVKPHLHDGRAGADDIEAWGAYLDRHRADPAFTAAFYERLGVDGALRLPMLVEDAYPMDDYGDPTWGLEAIRPFSEALATALTRLPDTFANDLADYPGSYGDGPDSYHHGLLFTAPNAAFPTTFLVRLADNAVSVPMWRNYRAGPLHITPFGPAVDPVANVLGALSRNQEAATRWLEEPFPDGDTNLQLLIARYANDLDGDGGRNAAAVLATALGHPDRERSANLFEQTMEAVNETGAIRNQFNVDVLADAAALHIDRLQHIAAYEDDRDYRRLITAHDFLERLLADSHAATKVYDAALGSVYDTVGRAKPGDTLGSEAWDVGSLLGLLLTADRNADIDSTKERIAHRQALLDGLGQITDLGLTFVPGGKWLPFAKAGEHKLLDHFKIDGELDKTLERADAFENGLRFQLSAVFAVRLAVDGKLPPPPADHRAFVEWVNNAHDVTTLVRTEAGQRMDEVERLLPDRG
jgi:hypothetical protein